MDAKVLFRDFICMYMSESVPLFKFQDAEPIIVNFSKDSSTVTHFMLAVDWHTKNQDDLRLILSDRLYNSYVDKFGLTEEGRIFVTVGDEGE